MISSAVPRRGASALLAVSLLTILVAPLLGSVVASAQEATPTEGAVAPSTALTPEEVSEKTLALTIKYMSPYCPGSNLRDCTSGKAAVLREEIRGWVAEGRSEDWITNELVSRYGESILSAPRFKGFNMLVWVFPVIAVVVGLAFILRYLQRQHAMSLDTRVPVREVPQDGPVDPDLEKKLESELSARAR